MTSEGNTQKDWLQFVSYVTPGRLFVLLRAMRVLRKQSGGDSLEFLAQPGETIWIAACPNTYRTHDPHDRNGFTEWSRLDVYYQGEKSYLLFYLRDTSGWISDKFLKTPELILAPV